MISFVSFFLAIYFPVSGYTFFPNVLEYRQIVFS